jgi:mRNA interferase HigB
MRVIKKSTILEFSKAHPQAKQQLLAWYEEAKHAHWTSCEDIRRQFKTADCPNDHIVIFDIKGNSYRLIIRIHYANENSKGVVYIRWFGSHAEYDKIKDLEKI